ncbi:hypothetical protein [Flavobacterium selenitireducens]|uniref:hypothetical protein n=1 Tax=Flavobacterium selenitireducens TaxID=2722704 RepID=UPI00168A7904|nr:hypothetical protein [Flavobacterium selenitireducens]MBD3582749.1 hypothetical protein [Flavobacterium selenitireducens]
MTRKLIHQDVSSAETVFRSVGFLTGKLNAFRKAFDKTGYKLEDHWPAFSKLGVQERFWETMQKEAMAAIPSTVANHLEKEIQKSTYSIYSELKDLIAEMRRDIQNFSNRQIGLSDITFQENKFFVSKESKKRILEEKFSTYIENDQEQSAVDAGTKAIEAYNEFNKVMQSLGMRSPLGFLNLNTFCTDKAGEKVLDAAGVVRSVRWNIAKSKNDEEQRIESRTKIKAKADKEASMTYLDCKCDNLSSYDEQNNLKLKS